MSLKTFFFPLAVIISVFLIIWVVIPRWEIVQEVKNQLNIKTTTAENLDTKKTKLNEGMALYKDNMRNASVIYNALPSEMDNDVFVDELFSGAKDKGVLITNIRIDKAKSANKDDNNSKNSMLINDKNSKKVQGLNDVFEFSFKLEAVGGYVETKNFVGFMESANRLFVVDDISMINAEDGVGVVNSFISGTAFYKKDNPSLKVASVIYTNEPVLKSLIDDDGGGLNVEFINSYKKRIVNSDYLFNPAISGIGKENLFSGGGIPAPVEEAGNVDVNSTQAIPVE